jgi:6-phosphogluconolactonase (cycloisomerase 2 family)
MEVSLKSRLCFFEFVLFLRSGGVMRRNSSQLPLGAVSLVCLLVLAACNTTPVLRYVLVSPSTALISVGGEQQFTATFFYSDGTSKDGTALVSWSSSKPAVAAIGAGGVATGAGPGTTTITATAGGPSGTATLSVNQLNSIAVSPTNPTITVGDTQAFTATGNYTNPDGSPGSVDVTGQVTWSSDTATVATIDSTGLATAVGAGHALISATLNDVTGSTTLTVNAAGPSLVITPSAPQTIAIGNAITFNVQEKDSLGNLSPPAGTVTWTSSSTSIAGIVATPATSANAIAAGVAFGTTTITATEGALVGHATLNVVAGTTKFAYVANNGGGTVGADNVEWYSVDVTSATPFTSPNTTGSGNAPIQVVLHPSLKYLYSIDSAGNIYVYNVAADGSLTTTGFGPAAGGSGVNGDNYFVAVDPYGLFLYVTDSGLTTINGFTISQTDGHLTQMTGAPLSFADPLDGPQGIVIDHAGQNLYVTNDTGNTVSGFSIDPSSGALAELSPATQPTGAGPTYGALDPAGTHLYVANGDNTVTIVPIGAGGAMGTPATTAAITGANTVNNLSVDPSGTNLYVLDVGATNGQIYGFTLTSGSFDPTTPITGTPQPVGNFPIGNMVIDPTGALLATTNNLDGPPGTISLFKILSSPAGSLSPETPATVNTGNAPEFIALYNAP